MLENDDYHAILGFVAAGVERMTTSWRAARAAPAAEAMLEVLLAVGSEWEHAGQTLVFP